MARQYTQLSDYGQCSVSWPPGKVHLGGAATFQSPEVIISIHGPALVFTVKYFDDLVFLFIHGFLFELPGQ